MLGACKKHPQAYLLYVEDCFLQSDNADALSANVRPCTFADGEFLLKQKTSLLFYPSSIRGHSETYYALQLSLSLCNLYISR